VLTDTCRLRDPPLWISPLENDRDSGFPRSARVKDAASRADDFGTGGPQDVGLLGSGSVMNTHILPREQKMSTFRIIYRQSDQDPRPAEYIEAVEFIQQEPWIVFLDPSGACLSVRSESVDHIERMQTAMRSYVPSTPSPRSDPPLPGYVGDPPKTHLWVGERPFYGRHPGKLSRRWVGATLGSGRRSREEPAHLFHDAGRNGLTGTGIPDPLGDAIGTGKQA